MRKTIFLNNIRFINSIIITFLLTIIVSCSDSNDGLSNFTTSTTGGLYSGSYPGGYVGGYPNSGGIFSGAIVQDQYSNYVTQALNSTQCPLGRVAKSLTSGPNGQANRIYGPFQESGTLTGSVIATYIGGNSANGDIMVIRKLSNGQYVTGFHMELHLCIDNILVTPQRQLTNFQLRGNQAIILDQNATCAIGDIDYAAGELSALPGGFYNHSSPVYIGIGPLGFNYCGGTF